MRHYGIPQTRDKSYGVAACLTYWVFKCRDRKKSLAMGTKTWTYLVLPIANNSKPTEPMTQTTLEPQQTDLEDSVFIPSFSIKKLGKVLLGDHNNLPDTPGIYFAIDSANRAWYVGISTSSLRQRHAKHEKLDLIRH
jgi:hypothetical protein